MESDFLKYYHSEGMKRAITEEEKLELHKKQMAMESKKHQLEDDDDFYNEQVPVEESTRVNVPPRKLPPKRPIVPSKPAPAPAPRPAPASVQTPVNRVRTRASSQMDEALAMIDKITDKITSMFFKYGFDGLEKISRHLNEDIEEIVNPQPTYREDLNDSYNANEERLLELEEENNKLRRLLERQLERSQAEAAEKPVVRKATKPVIEETTIDESVDDVPEEIDEEIDETYGMPETDNKKLNEQFISMNENMDINALGASLSQQAAIQKRSESAGDTRLAQVAARAEMLQQSMNKKVDEKIASIEQQQDESFQQSEELEIVDVEEPTQPVENVKSTPAAPKSKKKVSKTKKSK